MMTAQNEKILKRRVEDYLWRDKSKTVSALRQVLVKEFSDFDNVSIFGGMIRDIARSGKRGFRSDVDLVIDAPAGQVRELASRLSAKPNLFGGFGYSSARWEIDFWALETSWAHRSGHIQASSIDDLMGATFFDWDAVHYNIRSRTLHSQSGYLEKVRSRTLGVNLINTPSPLGNAVRAVRRMILWDLKGTPALLDFVAHVLVVEGIEAFISYERRKHHGSICEMYSDRNSLLNALNTGNRQMHSSDGSPRQLVFPGVFR